jgi:hypothetical protein
MKIGLLETILIPFLISLLAAQVDRASGRISERLVRSASRLLPANRRQEELDEWLDHLASAGEHGLLPLTRALSIAFLAAPLMAVGLRIGRRHRARR